MTMRMSPVSDAPPIVPAAWTSRIDDIETARAMISAQRALLRATTVRDVAMICAAFVHELGGEVVAARSAPSDAIPEDLAFGDGDPQLAVAPAQHPGPLLSLLPELVEDAHLAVALLRRANALVDEAVTDRLTGLLNRRALDRLLRRLRGEDVVVMLDLDHFKRVNDSHGHAAGDRVLATFAQTIRHGLRANEWAARAGGEEFVIVLQATTVDEARLVLDRLRTEWTLVRPLPITFSAGVAAVGNRAGVRALAAADGALYEAKHGGRNRVVLEGTT